MKHKPLKKYSLDEVKDRLIGKKGSKNRNAYELEIGLDLLGETIKKIRKERHLTQEQLGKLVGVQKAQISKLENDTTDVRIDTILKIFTAMKAKVNINIELEEAIVAKAS